jgi:stage V sporulation protein G
MRPETTITEIQFVPVKPQDGLVGFASFVLDQKYFVGSVAVRTRLNGVGYRLVYPAKKVGDKSFQTFHPIDLATGKEIEEKVSAKVYELLDERHDEYSA